ncbi:MAG: hypothetical protein MJ002_09405, partial [Paludibacteraceae bacterium]|nr:hypothetical protein [Paludibacteraceae bacterium]
LPKASAKVLLFRDMTKRFHDYFSGIFLHAVYVEVMRRNHTPRTGKTRFLHGFWHAKRHKTHATMSCFPRKAT